MAASPYGPGGGFDPGLYYANYGDATAGFYKFLHDNGLGGNNPQTDFAQRQFQRHYGNYLGTLTTNPNLGFYDYLTQNAPGINNEYDLASAHDRGYNSAAVAGRGRWLVSGG
jgi:hypothetical protein